jgi:PAS domain S-box-containing protein
MMVDETHARGTRLPVALLVSAAAVVGVLLASSYVFVRVEDALVALAWVVASAAACVTGLDVVRRSASPHLERAWLAWSVACAVWCAGAVVRLIAEVPGWADLATVADVAWWMFPVLAGASILEDAPRGSLSFGLFLLDALPLVLLVTLLARLASPEPLDAGKAHELILLGYPLLYLLLALVGLQTLALEHGRLRSPNLWGFAVCQPLLAIAALTWPSNVISGSPGPSFTGEMIWALGFLAAGVCAVVRLRDPDSVPELRPLDDSSFRALPPAVGTVGLLAVAAVAGDAYSIVPLVLAAIAVVCFTGRAFLIQRENRLAQENLEISEEKHRTLVDNIPGAVYRCAYDENWTIDFMSGAIEELTGYPAESFVGSRVNGFSTIEHPDDTEILAEVIRRDVAAGRPYQHEYRIVRADGEVRWVLDKGQAAYGPHGEVLWLDGVLLDVTARKRTEERFERQTELLWLLQRVAVAANEAREADEALQVCLDEVCAYTGWPVGHAVARAEGEDELTSTGLWSIADDETSVAFREESEALRWSHGLGLPGRVLETGRALWIDDVGEEENYLRGDAARAGGLHSALGVPVLVGTEVVAVLEFYSAERAVRDDSLIRVMANVGTVLGRVVERTRAEQALAAQNDQLRQLDALKDEFVSLVSHELRTPLTSIRGYLELVLDDAETTVPEEHRQYLAVVQRNSERLLRLVGDLLFVAQLDAGRLSVEKEALDLGVLAEESVQAATPTAGARGVAVALDAGPAPLAGDRSRLAQLVDNLVSNAVKFTPEGGRVDLRVRTEEDAVVLEVSDSGMGIPAEEQPQLFERFFRSSNARRAAVPGTGLGLVIVRAIAEAHGGDVSVESTEGAGTTFTVRLPAGDPAGTDTPEELPMQEVA